jgi:hypothetical protein
MCGNQPLLVSGHTATGMVCNLAARLCAEAKDGQILVSSRIAEAVGAIARLEDLGNLELKGLRRPVAAFNIVQSTTTPDAGPNLTVVATEPGRDLQAAHLESGLMPNDDDWLRRLAFFGHGDWVGYVVATIVGMLILGLYYLVTSFRFQKGVSPARWRPATASPRTTSCARSAL